MGMRSFPSSEIDPPVHRPEVHDRQADDEKRHRVGQCRAHPELVVLEGDLPDVERRHLGGVRRPAPGHHVDDVEHAGYSQRKS